MTEQDSLLFPRTLHHRWLQRHLPECFAFIRGMLHWDAYFKEGHGGWERVIAGIAEEFDLTTSDAVDVVDYFKKMENAK